MCESLPSPATLKTFSRSQPFFRTLLVSRSRTPLAMNLLLASFSRLKCLRVLDLSHLWNIESLAPQIGHIKHLRYLNLRNTGIASLPKFVYKQLNLQTLVLSYNEKFTLLPSSIENLKHLRYLDLSNTGITILPESICSLTDLRTLKLKSPKLKMLPKCMRNMRSLRHVEMYPDHAKLTGMPVGIGELTSFQTLSLFVVSPTREFAGIQELGRLHQLKGLLMIKGLRHVPHQNDAQQANLMSKNLSELYLLWSGDGVDVDSSQEINSKEVLEGLQPHANVQKLWIEGYPGVIFPSWVGSSTALPTLTSLTLNDMPNLEGWSSEHLLPSRLKALRIGKCPKLTLPTLPSSIEKLTVERCNDPTLSSVENLPHLSFLEVFGFDEIETLREVPLGNHTSLETLYIMNFRKLKSLSNNLENLTTLANLRIVGCGELDSISEGLQNLASLQDFRLCALPKLKSLSLQALTALQILELNTCRILDVSVVEFQHLVALRELKLRKLPQLTSLPEGIRNVTTLENLEIWSCRSMTKLPEWLQHLPALVSLKIQDCHADLHKRCEKDNGEYWPKISHLRVYNEIAF
ncbi:hypothetical protein IFM89_006555 [Coptis chinensis]|uniref:Uncharacterized protein n=1 Tax=Coptis chinensis TaxID=261450 RepID=A0A835IMM8_9MAGN|nr:hypothetical protein IFM89_006555 [Coptis chinensis]